MSKVLDVYTDASADSERSYFAYVALTNDTHVKSRVYKLDTKNIYEAEYQAAVVALTEIDDADYSKVVIHMDNQAACYKICNMIADKEPPFNKFKKVTVEKIKGHQDARNPNKVADMLASVGRSYYYDSSLQPRILYRCQYPARVKQTPENNAGGKIQTD